MSTDVQLLIARILLAGLFLVSGFGLLFGGFSGFAGYMGSLGLPAPTVVTAIVVAIKVLGSIALILGFQTRPAAYVVALFCVGAAIIGHHNFADQADFTQFLKDIAIAGGLVALAIAGPGSISVDARRA